MFADVNRVLENTCYEDRTWYPKEVYNKAQEAELHSFVFEYDTRYFFLLKTRHSVPHGGKLIFHIFNCRYQGKSTRHTHKLFLEFLSLLIYLTRETRCALQIV